MATEAIVGTDTRFESVFRSEFPYVSQSLRRLGVREGDIDDVAQEVFVSVHGKFGHYDARRPVRPWLFAFAVRAASNYRNRASVRREESLKAGAHEMSSTGSDESDKAHARRVVMAALQDIELDRRAVFIAHEIDGVSPDEIARQLSIAVGTVYTRLHRARAEFTKAVERIEQEKPS